MYEDEVPAHLQPGAMIAGRFRVVQVLGIGGMGAVLEAENVALGQRVALKVLRRELLNDREAHSRLDQEARVVSQLVTDHVARVHDLGKTELGEPFIVMELLRGRNLDALIEAPEQLSITRAVDLVCEACVGLAVAHAAGMVHRDIKPGNLFVTERVDGSDIVKVLDFGLTKVTRSDVLRLTTSASVFGTPLYMSPEQIMSSKKVDTRTDQHAMAMVLFELLTKHPPFFDESPTAVTVKIATLPPPSARSLRADIPPALDGVIMKALGKAPADRFDDIALFALALAPHGSARADTAAKRAAAALNRPAIAPEVITPPAAVARSAETVTGLSTKRRIEPPSPSKWGAVAIGGAAVAGIVGAALVYQLGPPSRTASGSGATAASETAASEPARTNEPTVAITPPASASAPATTAPVVEPSGAASATAEPRPTAAAPKVGGAPKPKPTAKPTAAPTGGGEYIPKYK